MNTRARIATVCFAGDIPATVEKMRQRVMELLSIAAADGTDLVVLPETCISPRGYVPPPELAEPVPGQTIDAVSRIARERRCYIICPLVTKREGQLFNSAVVIGRSGEIVGIYDKLQPVTSSPQYTEFEGGIAPGRDLPVFDLDFGRIAIQICFDAGFSHNWRKLADKDVRAVFWCSAYNGGFMLQAYAALHQYHVISSVRSSKSRFIDPCGRVTAQTGGQVDVIWRDINLDFAVCHSDFNYALPERIAAKYGPRVNIQGDVDTATLYIEPVDPAITIAHLQQEFGFETWKQYMSRHVCALGKISRGENPEPQQALHGDRPMYTK